MDQLLAVKEIAITYGLRFVGSIIGLFIGLRLIKIASNVLEKSLKKSKVDESLRSFIESLLKAALKTLLFITIATTMGMKMTSFVAVLGAAGLAVGLALQGSLSNFAGGVLILLFKPFKIGDFIEAQGYSGTVKEIQIFYTILDTVDNKRIVIPNGNLSNNSCVNYSANSERRVDLKFGVSYEADIRKVKEVLNRIVKNHNFVLQDRNNTIRVIEHGDSSVNFTVRVWCEAQNYWDVYYDLMETVKEEFDKEGIEIPYPHMDVKVSNK